MTSPSQSKNLSPRAISPTAALLVAALAATPSLAGDTNLDHEGDGRCFDVSRGGNGSVDILSRGDSGCLNADVQGAGGTTIFMLGNDVSGNAHVSGYNGSVYLGMCPPGMELERVVRTPGSINLHIPRCI